MIQTVDLRAADGAATGARYTGERGPALVFVHGVGSTGAIWDAQLAAFAPSYRCFAVELRGNGVPKPEDPAAISRAGFAEDVLAVAAWAGLDRFTLVGCSLGGVVAFELWSQHAERFDAMAIVGSFAAYPNARAYADGVIATARDLGSMRAFAAARAPKLGLPPERERETIEQMEVKSLECYIASTEATWTGDYMRVLPTIGVPTLVACGARDTIAPLALSEAIAAGIPGARLQVVPEAGHVANADNVPAFNAMLAGFLREAGVG